MQDQPASITESKVIRETLQKDECAREAVKAVVRDSLFPQEIRNGVRVHTLRSFGTDDIVGESNFTVEVSRKKLPAKILKRMAITSLGRNDCKVMRVFIPETVMH